MDTDATFKVFLYMKQFYPSEIHLSSVGPNLTVHAKHNEHVDQHGFVKREVIWEYALPDGISNRMLEAVYARNGVLTIQTKRKQTEDLPKRLYELTSSLTAIDKDAVVEIPVKIN